MTRTHPTRVGKYQLGEIIGEGAMGTVYRATDPALGREVAVKLMRQSVASDPHLRDRFEREAKAAAGLQHPNIVTIHDFGEARGHLYIVMEFVSGSDLAQLIRGSVPLSLDVRLNIVVGVLEGLGYAHSRGIVHRDVKPANIRVLDDGRVKIMDFGIAHLTGSDITNSGLVLGTPDYMAPEQIEGRPITPATDIFAVGAILYELLTNQKPFEGDTVHAVLHKVVTQDPAPLGHRDATLRVSDGLQEAVRRALAKDANSRYPSAEAMVDAVNAARRSIRERDSESTILLQPSKTSNRLRPRVWLAAAAAGAVVAAGSAVRMGAPSETTGRNAIPLAVVPVSADTSRVAPFVVTWSVSESAFAPLRRAALDVRGRAGQAGASTASLAPGDSFAREADGLAAIGRSAEAVERLAAATTRWQEARERAEAAQQRAVQPVDLGKTAETTAARLAQAIAGRDVEAIRRIYPNLASDELDRWVEFFQSTDSIAATLHADSVEQAGARASVIMRGVFDYIAIKDARRKREAVEYRATFERAATGWRLSVIRKGFFRK